MSWLHDFLVHSSRLIQKWEGKAVTELKTLEADAEPFFKQVQITLTADMYAIARTELTTALTAAMNGKWPCRQMRTLRALR